MVIVSLTGGLGNQLFQYALGRRLAEEHGTELLLDRSGYGPDGELRPPGLAAFPRRFKLSAFSIKARVATAKEIACLRDDFYRATLRDRAVRQIRRVWPTLLWPRSHRVERRYRFQPEALSFPDPVYLQGYWQSPKYFDAIGSLLREEIQPNDRQLLASACQTVDRLKRRFGRVISVHVRRGDLAHAHEILGRPQMTYGAPVRTDYLDRAMQRFSPYDCFLVFSDSPKDMAWCRENLRGKHLEFSPAESDVWDFVAMSLCDHHIIANSTFSWWAAWLDNKPGRQVVAPRVWSQPKARFPIVVDDLLPTDWQVI